MKDQNKNKKQSNSSVLSPGNDLSEIYNKVLNSLTDGVFITNKNDTLVFCNYSLRVILEQSKSKIVGKNFIDFFNNDNYKELNELYKEVKEERFFENRVIKLEVIPEVPIFISCSFIPLDDDKSFNGLIGIIKNVTQKTKEEKDLIISHTLLKDAERLTRAGSWDWNIDTGITFWSDNCFRIHGLKKEDGVPDFTEHLAMLIPSDQERMSAHITNALNKNENYDIEYKIISRDDHSVKYLHSFAYVFEDEFNQKHIRGITVDITDKKNEEEEIDKKINDLEKFNKYMVGREERMVELKTEVNTLLSKLDLPQKYFVMDELEKKDKDDV